MNLPQQLCKEKNNHGFNGLFDARIAAFFSARAQGNMSLRYGDTGHALKNRQDLLKSEEIDIRSLVCGKQVHGGRVNLVGSLERGRGALEYETALPDTDAFITNKPKVAIAIFTADCLPVFLYDPAAPAVGLAHAGWRSTAVKIVVNTVRAMAEKFKTRPSDVRVFFGPAMRSCCYEVSREFTEIFPHQTCRHDGKLFFDLVETNRRQLVNAGVEPGHIFDSAMCTFCRNDSYFSYRKEGPACGRMMSVMMLR